MGTGAEANGVGLLLDVMLGKLSTYLRMCGYDAAYAIDRDVEADDALLELAETEGRTVVTRDEELARRADGSILLVERDVTEQLRELVDAGFELELTDEPTHCSACNGRLERVDRTEPTPEYAPTTDEQAVWRCRECGQHFWKGSHWDDVAATLDALDATE
ncbi:MAG: Mut7-C RNAse domain-containing protein [Haloarculaceae archaeon]